MEPLALHDAHDRPGVARDDGGAALSTDDLMTEEEQLGFGLSFVEPYRCVLKDLGRRVVLS
jgi:hypothetical protein